MSERYDYSNDFCMEDFYDIEFRKIPKAFQFKAKQSKVFRWLIGILLAIDAILLAIIPWTGKAVESGIKIAQHELMITKYSVPLFVAILVVFACVVVLCAWIFLAILMDKKAYKDASEKFARYKTERQIKERREHRESRERDGMLF